ERVVLRPGVRVYPVKEDAVLMIHEFRNHEGVTRWKFIGGWMDKEGKTELEIAKEELLEEVGMKSDNWEKFHVFDTGEATVGIRSTFFIARNPVAVTLPPLNPDQDRVIESRWVTLEELWRVVDAKEIWWDYDAFAAIQ